MYSCAGLSQVDIGYKDNCLEDYTNVIYEALLYVIDTTTINIIVEKYEKENCNFKIYVILDTKTGYPKDIIINDMCNILSDNKKEEYKILLSKKQFDICHADYFLKGKLVNEIYHKGSININSGDFTLWWRMKILFQS